MSCEFCLRGDAECLDMSPQIVDATLEQIECISSLVISGGEPCLNVPMIKYILGKIKEKGIICYSFYIVTNGLIYSEELVLALIDFYSYCIDECGGEAEICGLAVSLDEYHNPISSTNYTKYKALSFYDNSKEGNFNSRDSKRKVLDVGNAHTNGLGRVTNRFVDEGSGNFCLNEFGKDSISVDTVYVNALGNVMADCDLSYVLQNELSQGNILDSALTDIIINSDEELRQYFLKTA